MSDHLTLSSSQVDKCGELLVQYQLLRHGIEAAAITTDPSIDLLAYSGVEKRPFAIQVRTQPPADAGWSEGHGAGLVAARRRRRGARRPG